jgi:hypothetical protein
MLCSVNQICYYRYYILLYLLIVSDIAISAPFTETGSSDPGTVYIYHSSPSRLLTDEPQQVCGCTGIL